MPRLQLLTPRQSDRYARRMARKASATPRGVFNRERFGKMIDRSGLDGTTIVARVRAIPGAPRLSAPDLSRYRHGPRTPGSDALGALCVVLGCSADYVLGLRDDP